MRFNVDSRRTSEEVRDWLWCAGRGWRLRQGGTVVSVGVEWLSSVTERCMNWRSGN